MTAIIFTEATSVYRVRRTPEAFCRISRAARGFVVHKAVLLGEVADRRRESQTAVLSVFATAVCGVNRRHRQSSGEHEGPYREPHHVLDALSPTVCFNFYCLSIALSAYVVTYL